jgi:hypothetical protein
MMYFVLLLLIGAADIGEKLSSPSAQPAFCLDNIETKILSQEDRRSDLSPNYHWSPRLFESFLLWILLF